jgi:transcriptional regulator with XRE-family HTH domain
MARPNIQISGERLRDLRKKLFLTQRELGQKIGISEVRIAKIEQAESSGIYPSTLRALADAMSMRPDQLLVEIGVHAERDVRDGAIDPNDLRPVPEIPTFELAVAAGPWADVCEVAELHSPRQIADGRFRIRIKGDSMSPKFPHGTLVEFRHVPCGVEVEIGKNYYVQVDSMATFKHLEKADGDTLTLRALNKKKYPEPMIVRCAEVVRMARAIAIVVLQD